MLFLANLIRSTKAQVTFVSEIKSSKVRSIDLVNRFDVANSFVVPSRGASGGLWLMWNDDLQVHVHSASFHVILAIAVHSTSNLKFGLVCIYGDPYHRQTCQIWSEVVAFAYNNSSLPMLCIGDMNELLYDMDKSNANVNYRRMYAFRALIKNCGFFDLGFSGPAYTWTNRRFSSKLTYERLDRGLVNPDWCAEYPLTKVLNLPVILSDHAPILITTEGRYRKPKHSFKFDNWWLQEMVFQSFAKNA